MSQRIRLSSPHISGREMKYIEEAIKDRINKTGYKPKAIILVHLYGLCLPSSSNITDEERAYVADSLLEILY